MAWLQAGTETREERENKQAEMEMLGADPDIYEKLTNSVAPSIWQMDDVKKGILCQLFGGSSKVRNASIALLSNWLAWTAQLAHHTEGRRNSLTPAALARSFAQSDELALLTSGGYKGLCLG